MLEIELKAHVDDWDKVEEKLKASGKFIKHVQRNDTYYKMLREDWNVVKVRIREEIDFTNNLKKTFLTYKQKEMRKNTDGSAFEVNEEKECEISDSKAMEDFLFATGFSVDLKKLKGVFDYEMDGVLCELCTVPPIGDFLELEILVDEKAADKRPYIVEETREKLVATLEKAGISKEKIEDKYYSDLLRDKKTGL